MHINYNLSSFLDLLPMGLVVETTEQALGLVCFRHTYTGHLSHDVAEHLTQRL